MRRWRYCSVAYSSMRGSGDLMDYPSKTDPPSRRYNPNRQVQDSTRHPTTQSSVPTLRQIFLSDLRNLRAEIMLSMVSRPDSFQKVTGCCILYHIPFCTHFQ